MLQNNDVAVVTSFFILSWQVFFALWQYHVLLNKLPPKWIALLWDLKSLEIAISTTIILKIRICLLISKRGLLMSATTAAAILFKRKDLPWEFVEMPACPSLPPLLCLFSIALPLLHCLVCSCHSSSPIFHLLLVVWIEIFFFELNIFCLFNYMDL